MLKRKGVCAAECHYPLMLSTEDGDLRVVYGFRDLCRPVRGTVIDEDHLPVMHCLGQDTADAVLDERRMLIGHRHNGGSGHQRTPDQVCVSVGGS